MSHVPLDSNGATEGAVQLPFMETDTSAIQHAVSPAAVSLFLLYRCIGASDTADTCCIVVLTCSQSLAVSKAIQQAIQRYSDKPRYIISDVSPGLSVRSARAAVPGTHELAGNQGQTQQRRRSRPHDRDAHKQSTRRAPTRPPRDSRVAVSTARCATGATPACARGNLQQSCDWAALGPHGPGPLANYALAMGARRHE